LSRGKAYSHVAQIYAILILSIIAFHVLGGEAAPSLPGKLLLTGAFYVADFLVLMLFVSFVHRTPLRDLGFTSENRVVALASGLLASAGYIVLVPFFQVPAAFSGIELWIPLFACFMIGLTEEGFFRGYIQGRLKQAHESATAIALTALLFSAAHIPKYLLGYPGGLYASVLIVEALRSVLIIGVLLGFLYEIVGNLWCVILAHATWDLYLILFPPPQSLDLTSLLGFLLLSTVTTGGTMGASVAWALQRTRTPLIIPWREPPRAEALRGEPAERPRTPARPGVTRRHCTHCGAGIPPDAVFCGICGKRIQPEDQPR